MYLESLKVKSPDTTANSRITKRQTMKYPTAESLSIKNLIVKIIVKKTTLMENLTAITPAVKNSTKEKLNCIKFKSKGKMSNNNKPNEEKSLKVKFQTI